MVSGLPGQKKVGQLSEGLCLDSVNAALMGRTENKRFMSKLHVLLAFLFIYLFLRREDISDQWFSPYSSVPMDEGL